MNENMARRLRDYVGPSSLGNLRTRTAPVRGLLCGDERQRRLVGQAGRTESDPYGRPLRYPGAREGGGAESKADASPAELRGGPHLAAGRDLCASQRI